MTQFHTFTVSVTGCTLEQARQVMAERIGPDEDYGFDYTVDWADRQKPSVVVIENPQEDPTYEPFGDVEVSTMTTYPFSKWAEAEEARQYTEDCLAMLRDQARPQDFRTWLQGWLKEELATRDRDFQVDWTTFTLAATRVYITVDSDPDVGATDYFDVSTEVTAALESEGLVYAPEDSPSTRVTYVGKGDATVRRLVALGAVDAALLDELDTINRVYDAAEAAKARNLGTPQESQ